MRPQFLQLERGATATLQIALTAEDGSPFDPTDFLLVGCAKLRTTDANADAVLVWRRGTFPDLLPFSREATEIQIVDAAAGLVSVAVAHAETKSLPGGSILVFDIRAGDLEAKTITTVARGSIKIRSDVTREVTTSIPIRSGS